VILENLEDDIDSADSSMKSMRSRMNALYAQTASSERAQWSIILCLLGERSAAALAMRPPCLPARILLRRPAVDAMATIAWRHLSV